MNLKIPNHRDDSFNSKVYQVPAENIMDTYASQ